MCSLFRVLDFVGSLSGSTVLPILSRIVICKSSYRRGMLLSPSVCCCHLYLGRAPRFGSDYIFSCFLPLAAIT